MLCRYDKVLNQLYKESIWLPLLYLVAQLRILKKLILRFRDFCLINKKSIYYYLDVAKDFKYSDKEIFAAG